MTLILLILAIKEVLFLGHCTKCEKPGGNTIVSPENANVPSENGLYRPEMQKTIRKWHRTIRECKKPDGNAT
nr:hypothetical protein [uncultured Draconibacterium sp.]